MNITLFNGRRLDWRGILALILVPLLLAGGVMAGTWNFDQRLHRVEAAVVNDDEMVELNGQKVPLGRQLAAALVDSKRDQNFTWVLADAKSAQAGLASGRYAAAVWIPKDFSKNATGFAGKGDTAQQATVTIETSPVAGIAETAVGQSVADAAASSVNSDLTKTYLDNIYLGFNKMGEQMTTVADGAGQLADGAKKLDDGVGQASDGTTQLAGGLKTAADGGTKLKDAGTQLVDGGKQLVDGGSKLTDGGAKLKDGGKQLTDGGAQLATGASELAKGLGTMADQTKDLPAQSKQLSDGAKGLATGTKTYTDGVGQYVDGINALVDPALTQIKALPDLTASFDAMDPVLKDLPANAVKADAALGTIVPATKKLLADSAQLRSDAAALTGAIDQAKQQTDAVASGTQTVPCPESLQSVEGACAAYAQGVVAGAKRSQAALADVDTAAIAQTSQQFAGNDKAVTDALDAAQSASGWLATNAATLSKTWQGLRQQIPSGSSPNQYLIDQLTKLRDGGNQLKAGGTQLATGSAQLADGVGQFADGMTALAGGIKQASDGASKLSDGVSQYVGGVGTYVGGVGTFVDGVSQYAAGVSKFNDGVGQYAGGVGQFADGVSQASDGATKLADGMTQLKSGSSQLSGGTTKLADGLAQGVKQMPSYSQTQRTNLAQAVTAPISRADLDSLVTPAASVASLLSVLALWLGSMATYALIKPVDPRNAASSLSTRRLVGRALLPGIGVGVVQALLVTGLTAAFLKMAPVPTVQLGGVLVLAGVAFALVNHALAAWSGLWGRLAAFAFIVLTGVTALTATAPGIFAALRPLSPMTPALDAVHALLVGRSPALLVVLLVVWALVGGLAGAWRIMRSRTVRVKDLALDEA